ncbi:MAG: riboflavin synthase [Pedosphaera sp.]|nr:riboflavin synthase [Pedosphaera sp.]
MFTGLVEETAVITQIVPTRESTRLWIRTNVCSRGTRVGDSIAVNGCCLTVVARRRARTGATLGFDLLQETWQRTTFSTSAVGDRVNLERALAVGSRLGGHFVTGHIDGIGRILRWEKVGKDHLLEVAAPKEVGDFLLTKGSIAIDGISLTVAAVMRDRFRVWIIPHTFQVTSLTERQIGDRVNLEADLLGKYVRHFTANRKTPRAAGRRTVRE